MMQQINIEQNQPRTHSYHKHWRQWIFCEDYDLTREELKQFYEYYRECNLLFQNNQRWDIVDQLYKLYFGGGVPQREGKHWIRLGFQGSHPQTDFRGGGIFSLKIIYQFAKENKQLVEIMEKDKGGYFYAVTTINICYFLKKYFHLADFLIPVRDANEYCNRRALKNFVKIIVSSKKFLQLLNKMLIKYFYNNIWIVHQKNANCQKELLNFNMLFQQLKKKVREIFQCRNIGNFDQFIIAWNDVTRI